MLQLNQKGQAFDLVQALEGDSGVFRARGPNGQLYEIIVRPGVSIISKVQQGQPFQQGQFQGQAYGQGYPQGYSQQPQWQGPPQWQFRKIAELSRQGRGKRRHRQQTQQAQETQMQQQPVETV